MRKIFYAFIAVFFTVYLAGCAKPVLLKSENPQKVQLSKYQSIYVGWLDLGRDNWKKFYYQKPGDWQSDIRDANIDGLQLYLKNNLPSKMLTLAKTDGSEPAGEILAIIFTNTVIEEYDPVYIQTDINFIELPKNREVYKCSIKASAVRWQGGHQLWSFTGRLGACVHNIADFITEKLQ